MANLFEHFDHQPGERVDLPDPKIVAQGRGLSGLTYQIMGTTMPAVVVHLAAGHQVFAERGGMSWMSEHVKMETNMEGGIFGAAKRMFSGESLFMVTFTAERDSTFLGFAAELPGKIIPLQLGPGQQIICQKDAFMFAERSVQLDIHFRRKLGTGFFGGEGFIMQRVTGPGLAFFEIDGEVVEYTLQRGQILKVDTGYLAMMEPTVDFNIEMVRGFRNVLFGGEGLFLSTLRGPGRVWLQTMPAMNLANRLAQFMPTSGGSSSSGFSLGTMFESNS